VASERTSGESMYQIDIRNDTLNKYRVIRGSDPFVVQQKALAQLAQWEEMAQRRRETEARQAERGRRSQQKEENKEIAAERTAEAQDALDALEGLLRDTLTRDDTIHWETLKDRRAFPHPRPTPAPRPPPSAQGTAPREPQQTDAPYNPRLTVLDRLAPGRWNRKLEASHAQFQLDHARWREETTQFQQSEQRRCAAHETALRAWHAKEQERLRRWQTAKALFEKKQVERNAAIDADRTAYERGEPEAIVDYCELVLGRSPYPDSFPKTFEVIYEPGSRTVHVNYTLPAPVDLPRIKEVKYVQSRDEFQETLLTDRVFNELYARVLCQVALRTVHEVLEADAIRAVSVTALNGLVHVVDKASGHDETRCVLTLRADRSEFERLKLSSIDPVACFERLGGKTTGRLHTFSAVEPIPPPVTLPEEVVPLAVEDATETIDLSQLDD